MWKPLRNSSEREMRVRKFNYTMNHKADEAYMAKMCAEGYAATSLVEGV